MIKPIITATALATLFLSSCDKYDQSKKNQQNLKKTEQEIDQIKSDLHKEFDETGEINAEHSEKMIEAIAKAEKNATGDEAEAFRIIRVYAQYMQNESDPILSGGDKFDKGSDFSNIKSKADIDPKILLIQQYRTDNKTLAASIKNQWPRRFDELVNESKLTSKQQTMLKNGAGRKLAQQRPILIKIRESDIAGCDIIIAQLELLKEFWGKWSLDDEGFIDSDHEPFIEKFVQLETEMETVAEEQTNAQRALLNLSR